MRLATAAAYHQEALAGNGAAQSTAAKYAALEARFIAYVSATTRRAATLADLNISTVRTFLAWTGEQKGQRHFGGAEVTRGPSTLYLYGRMLKTWSTLLARERADWLPDGDPLAGLRVRRVDSPTIELFTRQQYDLLLSLCGDTPHPYRNRAVLYFLIETGCRLREMCDLTLPNLELADGRVNGRARILRPKNRKPRYVYFGRAASKCLELYFQHERKKYEGAYQNVFLSNRGTPLSSDSVQWLLRSLGGRADVSNVRCSPHTCRHTFATWYLQQNPGQLEQLRQILGHSNLKMVLIYAKLAETDVAARYRSVMDTRPTKRSQQFAEGQADR